MTPENTKTGKSVAADLTPENRELLDAYELHLSRSPLIGHAPRTYLSAVRGYLAWLQESTCDGDPLHDATAKNWAVRDYRSWLVTVGKRAPSTVNKILAALNDFYVSRNLGKIENVKRQQVQQHAPKALDERGAKRFLRAVEACPSARDRAIALTPFYAGARIAEVAALDVEDVKISARKGSLHLVGKGEKSRDVPLVPELRQALQDWLDVRSELAEPEEKALFVSARFGRRLSTDAIDDALHAITRKAGLDDEITAHVLRHTYATVKVRNGVDLVTVKRLMGHERIETTLVYTQPSDDDLEKAAMVRYTD
jgi:site-specific recombinase XerD